MRKNIKSHESRTWHTTSLYPHKHSTSQYGFINIPKDVHGCKRILQRITAYFRPFITISGNRMPYVQTCKQAEGRLLFGRTM